MPARLHPTALLSRLRRRRPAAPSQTDTVTLEKQLELAVPSPAWGWIALATILITAAIAVTLWWLLHNPPTAPAAAAARWEAIRTALLAGGGTGAALTLMLAFRRQRQQELQSAVTAELTRRSLESTTHDAAERRVTELYTKAVEQLGSDKAAVRLGGLYALERLAQDNEGHRQTIVNVICAYLRMPYIPPTSPSPADPTQERAEALRSARRQALRAAVRGRATETASAVQAKDDPLAEDAAAERQVRLTAQRILAGHLRHGSIRPLASEAKIFDIRQIELPPATASAFPWEGMHIDLTGATLIDFDFRHCRTTEARFDGATFIGQCRFDRAAFDGGGWFSTATFTDDAWFNGATFNGSTKFPMSTFSGRARFDSATFNKNADFCSATFGGEAHFGGTIFGGEYAAFDKAAFSEDARFSAARFAGVGSFPMSTFNRRADFRDATFNGLAAFFDVTFKEIVSWEKVTFAQDVQFNASRFNESISFIMAKFEGSVSFQNATFKQRKEDEEDIWQGKVTLNSGAGSDKSPFTVINTFEGATVMAPDALHRWPDEWKLFTLPDGTAKLKRTTNDATEPGGRQAAIPQTETQTIISSVTEQPATLTRATQEFTFELSLAALGFWWFAAMTVKLIEDVTGLIPLSPPLRIFCGASGVIALTLWIMEVWKKPGKRNWYPPLPIIAARQEPFIRTAETVETALITFAQARLSEMASPLDAIKPRNNNRELYQIIDMHQYAVKAAKTISPAYKYEAVAEFCLDIIRMHTARWAMHRDYRPEFGHVQRSDV